MPCSHLPPADAPDALRVDDAHLTETVLLLARGIAADLGFDRLPILADALEDAGCDNSALLNHLRHEPEHRVECWALRRLLRTTLLLPGGVPITFAYCPPGTFLMGSPESEAERYDDEMQHAVRLTRGFYCGFAPVTQAQWRAVMETDPNYSKGYLEVIDVDGGRRTVMGTDPSYFEGDDRPVEQVSWYDAQTFCARLRDLTGTVARLPTEAEWEYACRGGTNTPFYWGSELNGTEANCGNYPHGVKPYGTVVEGPYLGETTVVGRYSEAYPHPWGMVDFHGNVWEWCDDWFNENYSSFCPQVDPKCRYPNQWGRRVLRGGSWYTFPDGCRAAVRIAENPERRCDSTGFRVVFTA
ncbi:MAG: formylglycine-generating enzyme family protein [Armatimonadaceae bacterium]